MKIIDTTLIQSLTAPLDVQEKAGCVVGKDYPERIVIHEEVSLKNAKKMNIIKEQLLKELHQVSFLTQNRSPQIIRTNWLNLTLL